MKKLIFDKVNFIATYASSVDDWMIIKKEILKQLPSHLRSHFSTRDPKTKQPSLNDLEKNIIKHWKTLTGTTLTLK